MESPTKSPFWEIALAGSVMSDFRPLTTEQAYLRSEKLKELAKNRFSKLVSECLITSFSMFRMEKLTLSSFFMRDDGMDAYIKLTFAVLPQNIMTEVSIEHGRRVKIRWDQGNLRFMPQVDEECIISHMNLPMQQIFTAEYPKRCFIVIHPNTCKDEGIADEIMDNVADDITNLFQ